MKKWILILLGEETAWYIYYYMLNINYKRIGGRRVARHFFCLFIVHMPIFKTDKLLYYVIQRQLIRGLRG